MLSVFVAFNFWPFPTLGYVGLKVFLFVAIHSTGENSHTSWATKVDGLVTINAGRHKEKSEPVRCACFYYPHLMAGVSVVNTFSTQPTPGSRAM